MKKRISTINKILTVVFAALMCVLIPGYKAAMNYSTMVNRALGINRLYDIVEKGDGTEDTNYFPSDFGSDAAALSKYCDDVSKEVEGEGLVLLRNDEVNVSGILMPALPLPANSQTSTFFTASVQLNYSAGGSGGLAEGADNAYPTLETALEKNDFGVNDNLINFYKTKVAAGFGRALYSPQFGRPKTYYVKEVPWTDVAATNGLVSSFDAYGDAAIAVIAREGAEGSVDLSLALSDGENENYLSISPQERGVLEQLTRLKNEGVFKRIIVLLNSSAPMELDFMFSSGIDVDACMWIGNVGRAGIHAVSDALAGKIIPSGRASDTWCRNNLTSPAMANWILNDTPTGGQQYSYKGFALRYSNWDSDVNSGSSLVESQRFYGVYLENIYVGYRYYETHYEDYVLGQGNPRAGFDYHKEVAYPFGYGLSYTTFEYSNFNVAVNNDDTFTVSLKVTNTGNYAGREVVQIYLQKPYSEYDKVNKVEKASVELVGFAKTDVLAKSGEEGDHQTVTVTVDKETFKAYDSKTAKTYILSEGKYYLSAGKSAHDALNNILAAKGHTPANTGKMDKSGNAALVQMVWNNATVDTAKYSISKETGKAITNQLDFADINRYENRGSNSVTYVSRSDWTATWPSARIVLSVANEAMKADLGKDKPIVEDGSVSPKYGESNGLNLAMLRGKPYTHEAWDDLLNQMTFAEQAEILTNAGFGTKAYKNIGKPGTSDTDGPTTIVADSKTGASYPSQGIWASSFDIEVIEKVGAMFAEDARMAGHTSLYAPGLNMHRAPYGGRSHEYFSEDPFLSGIAAIAEVKGIQSKGVIPTLKHYAFNDQEGQRDGIGIWLNEQSAREIYLLPFEYAMRPSMGNACAIMTSFNRAGCIWTGASKELLVNINRVEWGWMGYSITDMVSSNGQYYMTHLDGLMNGSELYLAASGSSLSEYSTSPAFQNKMREATKRFLYIVCNYSAAMNGISTTTEIIPITPWWQVLLIALLISFGALTAIGIGVWIYIEIRVKTISKKSKT